MKNLLITFLLLGVVPAIAQTPADSFNHNFFTLDVGTPKYNSLRGSVSKTKLEAWTSDVVSIQLSNLNPFRYKYKLSGTAIDLFDKTPAITDTFKTTTETASDKNITSSGAITAALREKMLNAVDSTLNTKAVAASLTAEKANSGGKPTLTKNGIKEKAVSLLNSSFSKTSNTTDIVATIDTEVKKTNSEALKEVLSNVKSVINNNPVLNSIKQMDETITNSFRASDTATANDKSENTEDSVAAATAPPKLSEGTLSKLTTRIPDGPYNEQLLAFWEKMLESVDANLCQMQGLQNNMTTYLMYVKNLDNFNQYKFRSYRDGYRKSIGTVMTEYNRVINGFNSKPFTDTLGKFKILQDKTVQFAEAKAECDKILSRFYAVQLNCYLLPMDVNGKNIDLVEFKLERLDATTDLKVDEYKYQIWLKGGLKFDFSVGGFFSSLNNQKFITEDVVENGVTKKKILRDPEGTFKLGFGTMGNMSWRTGISWLRPGFSLGIIFTTAESFQVLAGPSLIMGKIERVVLHAGVSLGSVTQLRPEYEENGVYDLGTSNSVPTAKIFKAGGFFGLTYNLTKIKSAGVNMNQ